MLVGPHEGGSMFAWVATAFAAGGQLPAGEFRNNAYTTEAGAFAIHPLMKSHFGVTDRVDVKVPFVGEIFGPRGSVEVGLVQTERLAVSIEPEFALGWGFRQRFGGATARWTLASERGRMNFNVGGFYQRTEEPQSTTSPVDPADLVSEVLSVPVNVGYDLIASERTTWRFVGTTDAGAFARGVANGTVAFNWNHATGERFRVALGAGMLFGGLPDIVDDLDGPVNVGELGILPYPTVELWWSL
jgi:hypothetical protein